MSKKYRSQHNSSGDFTKYLIDYPKDENDAISIASDAMDNDTSDIDGEIIKVGDKDYCYENSNFLNNLSGAEDIDIDGLFVTLGGFGGKNTQIANLYNSIDKKEKEVVKPLLEHQQRKYYRQAAYQTIAKEVESWVPQISSNELKETITYGKPAPFEVNPQLLTSTITPINDFEKELAQAEANVKLLYQQNSQIYGLQNDSNSITSTKYSNKSIVHRQNMKNKQMNRIKSKNWHRVKRKGKEFLQEKLLSRVEVEDPELAKQIKYEIEIKAAERRLLRKREAQNKWAKMAIRYGGKEARAIASRQSQSLNDYEKNIISLAKKNDSDSDSDSDCDQSDNSDNDSYDANANEMNTMHPKVYNMKFMKRAREKLQSHSNSDHSGAENNEINSDCEVNPKSEVTECGDVEDKFSSIRKYITLNNAETVENNRNEIINSVKTPITCGVNGNKNDAKNNTVEDIVNQKRGLDKLLNAIPTKNNELACEIFTGNEEQLLTDSEEEGSNQFQASGWNRWISKTNQYKTNQDQNRKVRKFNIMVKPNFYFFEFFQILL